MSYPLLFAAARKVLVFRLTYWSTYLYLTLIALCLVFEFLEPMLFMLALLLAVLGVLWTLWGVLLLYRHYETHGLPEPAA